MIEIGYYLEVDIKNMQLNYTVKGQGRKNLILLHGWGGSLPSLEPLQNQLAQGGGYRVFNIEWPGFGSSKTKLKTALTFTDFVTQLEEFIKQQGILMPVLVGHSFGGKVAMAFAHKNPMLVKNLILINTSGLKPKNSIKKLVLFIPTKVFGAIFSLPLLIKIKPFIRKVYYRFIVREHDYLISESLEATFRSIIDSNLDDKIGNIETDTLLIWGEKDRQTPLWMGEKLAQMMPNAKIEVIKDSKHSLPLVNPELIATIIRLYIK